MSKSKGNIVNPSEIYNKYGADTLRLYILFIGPADSIVDWNDSGVDGSNRFLKRFWRLVTENIEFLGMDNSALEFMVDDVEKTLVDDFNSGRLSDNEKEAMVKLHQTIKKVTADILNRFNFNTAISAIMELVNLAFRYNEEVGENEKNRYLVYIVTQKLLLLLSPIAPFITEELWHRMGKEGSIHWASWPEYDENIAREEMMTIIFQVNGKLRDKADFPRGAKAQEVEKAAFSSDKIKKFIEGREILKKVFVADKLLNIVIRQ